MNVNFDTSTDVILTIQSPQAAVVHQSLNQAEEIFKSFDKADQSTKETMIGHLSAAFKELQAMRVGTEKIPAGFETTAARIFYLYGKCLYNGDMQASRRMFELALTLTFFELKYLDADAIPNISTDNLQELPSHFFPNCHDFYKFEKFLADHSSDALVELLPLHLQEKSFDIAMMFRWLGATYQNISDFHKEEYFPLFEKIYSTPIKIWSNFATRDSLWEAGSLIYNTGRFMHYLKHPGDIDGALKTLEAVQPFIDFEGETLRAKQLQAQIHNITGVEESKRPINTPEEKQVSLKKQFEEVSKASDILNSDNGFSPFLQKLFVHNKAAVAVICLKENMPVVENETLKSWFDGILSYMETEKYNHYYFAAWLKNAAEFEFVQNNLETALQHIEKAEAVAHMYPSSTSEALPKIDQLKKEIEAAIQN